MLKISICDDEKFFADLIYSYLTKILDSKSIDAELTKYTNSQMLVRDYEKKQFDVLFLDIDMPDSSGFDISKYVREKSLQTFIIFVSSKTELVYNSFEYNPFYFIRKSNQDALYNELAHVIDKLMLYYLQERKVWINDTVHGSTAICLKDIIYIKSEKHYLNYYADGMAAAYIERGSLSEKEAELNCPQFIRTHQRYIVNMRHIEKFYENPGTVILDNNQKIPVSKAMKDKAFQEYMLYKRR